MHERVKNNGLDQNLNDSNKNETLCTWVLFVNPFQTNVALHIETSHLFCRAKLMTGFYMKRNIGLK